jgi:hypothetical protein
MVTQLQDAGLEVTLDPETYPNGRFARLHDPEGNPVALWEFRGAGCINQLGATPDEEGRTRELGADRDLYSGLIRLHVLHHAVEGPVFGLGMMEELARHGYRISLGSLYPILHRLEKKGYLRVRMKRNRKSMRKEYVATPLGRRALAAAKSKVHNCSAS